MTLDDPIEVREVAEFLRTVVPFDRLDDDLLREAARQVHIRYLTRGPGDPQVDYGALVLYIVRTGAFEIRSAEGELIDRVDAGGLFGYPALLTGEPTTNHMEVLEDGLLYELDEATFNQLRAGSREFDRFFNLAHAKRLRGAVRRAERERSQRMTQRVGHLLGERLISVSPDTPVWKAAKAMTDARVSSLLIIAEERLLGIVTDRDLRNRVVAERRNLDDPVKAVMTRDPATVDRDAFLYEAVLMMSEGNIHHLPVVANGEPVGMLTSTDIIRAEKTDPVLVIGDIARQKDVDGLVKATSAIPHLLRELIRADARADEIGRIITTVTDALTRQLLKQAETRLGPPPIAYAWMAFGSQGRREQSAKSDQDNALVLADAMKPEHDHYFKDLANYVNDGLDACGYVYCPGEIMARTDRWRQPLATWQQTFSQWIDNPDPEALMHASIFFDLRCVSGDGQLVANLQQMIAEKTRDNQIFLACLTQNALQHTPPLGFFKQFVVERDGEHNKVLDLKHRGVIPITDIARIYALSAGLSVNNTRDRLEAAAEAGALTLRDSRSLCDALEFIGHLRLSHQGEQMAAGDAPNNLVPPDSVSALVRHQLRDAFSVVQRAQDAVKMKFTRGLL